MRRRRRTATVCPSANWLPAGGVDEDHVVFGAELLQQLPKAGAGEQLLRLGGTVPAGTERSRRAGTRWMMSGVPRPETLPRDRRGFYPNSRCWRGLRMSASTTRVRSPSCENTTPRLAVSQDGLRGGPGW